MSQWENPPPEREGPGHQCSDFKNFLLQSGEVCIAINVAESPARFNRSNCLHGLRVVTPQATAAGDAGIICRKTRVPCPALQCRSAVEDSQTEREKYYSCNRGWRMFEGYLFPGLSEHCGREMRLPVAVTSAGPRIASSTRCSAGCSRASKDLRICFGVSVVGVVCKGMKE